MRRLSARTTRAAMATIVLPALMITLAATPATAAAAPTVVVAAGFDYPQTAACSPDGNGATIPLRLADPDGRARDLTLTGASSDQALLPDAGITFSGGGAVRSVTLATVPGQTGQADVTITVSNAAATATVVIHTFAYGDGNDGTARDPQFGTLDSDLMLGRGGNDHLIAGTDDTKPPPGSTGRDTLCGGDGEDHLEGQDEEDTIDGQGGNDLVKGAQGNDIVRGGDGDDKISGRGGADLYSCGTDTVGDGSGDTIYGFRRNPTNGAQPDTDDGTCDGATNGSGK